MGLNKYQKGDFNSSTVAFYQINPFRNTLGYLNLWNILRFDFRQLKITFFIKLWWQKRIFLQMHTTIL